MRNLNLHIEHVIRYWVIREEQSRLSGTSGLSAKRFSPAAGRHSYLDQLIQYRPNRSARFARF